MKKFLLVLIAVVLLLPMKFINAEELNLAVNAKSAILIEASTGEIIFEKNSHERLVPASMTKMMSMLLIIESIEKGIISWDEMVTVSENASSMGGSQILLETNEKMSVSDLFKGIAVASGNDAVVAMAEKIAGTEDAFVNMMNNRAKELGLKDTNFKNPHGLDTANHYSSAYDMAMIAKELVKHEEVFKYTSIYEDYLRQNTDKEIWLVNTNKLVRFYDGVDGLKTGYTAGAGYCLTATAKKNGMRIIAVAMGEPDSKTRNAEITSMLDYAFAQYEIETVLSTESVLGKRKVEKGKDEYVTIVPTKNINLLYKKTDDRKNVTYDVKIDSLKAPIKKGDIVGKVEIKDGNNILNTIDVTVNNDVKKANVFELYLRNLKNIFNGNI
mgnify:FL=1